MYRDFGPRESRAVSASFLRRLRWFFQGLAQHDLRAKEKQAFFVVLRRLAAIHGRLPDSMIAEETKVSNEILASGGFADVRTGMYKGRLVAVKTMRVAKQDDSRKIRKVGINDSFSAAWNAVLIILPSNFAKKLSSGTRCPTQTS